MLQFHALAWLIGDGNRELVASLEQHQDRHGEKAVDGPCEIAELAPSARLPLDRGAKVNGKEQIGVDLTQVGRCGFEKAKLVGGAFGDVGAGELEDQLDFVPRCDGIESFESLVLAIKRSKEIGKRSEIQGALRRITEGVEKCGRRCAQGLAGERGDGFGDGRAMVGGGGAWRYLAGWGRVCLAFFPAGLVR